VRARTGGSGLGGSRPKAMGEGISACAGARPVSLRNRRSSSHRARRAACRYPHTCGGSREDQMRRKHVLAAVAAVATMAWLVAGGVAQATFPNFSDCPVARSETTGCVDIQSVSGSLEIKGFTVPLGESLEIRGGLDISTRPA